MRKHIFLQCGNIIIQLENKDKAVAEILYNYFNRNNKWRSMLYFEKNKFILSESILKSIYQGAMGEVIGKVIIEKKMLEVLNLKFKSLPIKTYEKFDNRIKNIYFDFKNWDGSSNPNLNSKISSIRRKRKLTQADKLVVVNILKPKYDVQPYFETVNDAVLVLLYLI